MSTSLKWNLRGELEPHQPDYNNVIRAGKDTSQLLTGSAAVRATWGLNPAYGRPRRRRHVKPADYHVRDFNANPVFSFNLTPAETRTNAPYQHLRVWQPISSHNNQYGIYVQGRLVRDVPPHGQCWIRGLRDERPEQQLRHAGLVVSELQGKVPAGYFTDGTMRPTYKKAFQPRIGFAYDVTGKGETVVFGGWGRYYDRNYYNALLDEKFRLQYSVLTFRFSNDGLPRDGAPTILWNPSYMSVAGLQGIVASGNGPKPQVFLINKNTQPPVSDEFSFGVRQSFGSVGASISYAGSRGRNGFTNIWNNFPCCQFPAADFDVVLISDATKKTWYDALLSRSKSRTRPPRSGARRFGGLRPRQSQRRRSLQPDYECRRLSDSPSATTSGIGSSRRVRASVGHACPDLPRAGCGLGYTTPTPARTRRWPVQGQALLCYAVADFPLA